jgi:VIT1/CCC1 family predicted Fe2+/Mn2+ transporter
MPATPHVEKHFTASERVRDVVIGMADGLTVPFALAAGLSAAVSNTSVVITAGLAEIAAGAIAMGLGGYLAARSDAEHYASERSRELWEIENKRSFELAEVRQVFEGYGLTGAPLDAVVASITADSNRWTDFMMKFELGLDAPDPKRALVSALTIGTSYLVGGLIPLTPYFVIHTMHDALLVSVATTGMALAVFGAVKGHFTGISKIKSAVQTLLVGGLAAGAAFWLAHLFG